MRRYLLFFLGFTLISNADSQVTPTFVTRSQGRDGVRKLVGVADQIYREHAGDYKNFSVMLEYTQSFKGDDIAKRMFGNDLDCKKKRITIQGSSIQGDDRDPNAWLADYFYLAPDYNSCFTINPRIKNFLVDLDLYVECNDLFKGMYLRLHGAINWTQWDLQFEEPCDVNTIEGYESGYMDWKAMSNGQLLGTFGSYACGATPLNTSGDIESFSEGNIQVPPRPKMGIQFMSLQYAQIDPRAQSRTGFADLRAELGWNFVQEENYHVGLNVQVAAPTGNQTSARRAFDPTIGNRNHWEVGGGLSAHYLFYHSKDGDGNAGFYVDLSLTHLNNAREERTFDLCGKPNSRYMLAAKMGPSVLIVGSELQVNVVVPPANSTAPQAVFESVYSPVANLTTVNIGVRRSVQADLVAMLNYTHKDWSFDLGYNLWAVTREKFSRPQKYKQCCPNLCDGSRDEWALKGDARMFGYIATRTVAVPLSATQCTADIHNGNNNRTDSNTTDCPGDSTEQNCGVDNPLFAYDCSQPASSLVFKENTGVSATTHIKTSIQPLFINCCDIDLQATRGISHKIFTHLNYTWDRNGYTPYLGVGGFAEFGKNDCKTCVPQINCDQQCDNTCCKPNCCSDSIDCSLSQWGIWLKGGVSFE